jgi:hypothetical protein
VACHVMPSADAPFRDWDFPQRSPGGPVTEAWTATAVRASCAVRLSREWLVGVSARAALGSCRER